MNRPALLVLLRHAESERNRVKRGATYFADEEMRRTVRGIPDHRIPITDEGRAQAERAGIMLRERFGLFDYAYHSGYLRTEQTLKRALSAYPERERMQIKIRQNPFIRERDPGHAYDMTKAEVDAAFPWLKEYWATFGGFFATPPGGESLAKVAERVYLFLNMLFRDRADQKILVVTHGGTIRCFRYLLEHWDYDRATKWRPGESPKNCALTFYTFDKKLGRLMLKEHNTVL